LTAYRTQLDVIAGNLAMKDVTRDASGNPAPYRRRVALFSMGRANGDDRAGVHVASIKEDPSPLPLQWAPNHVDAIREGKNKGYVRVSNVDYHTEMVNAMTASRAYEANISVMEMSKRMAATALRLIA